MPFQMPLPPPNNNNKTTETHSFTPPLKYSRTIKTLGQFGMADSDMFEAGLDPFFPMGYNKGFILNLDTVQHSFW